jgi:hypothetical protein
MEKHNAVFRHFKVRRWRRDLARFVRKWLNKNLVPLSFDTDVSFETWIGEINQTEDRKNELRKIYAEGNTVYQRKYHKCKSFIKEENYTEYKYPRCINSRADEMKVIVGPIFRAIEKKVFKKKWFIKKIPVDQRPDYIYEHVFVQGRKYLATDYSSFESQFTLEIMRDVEFQLYKHMTRFLPGYREFCWFLDNVLGGMNVCWFKMFMVQILATRMSGEMCTSLGTGFSNLMFMLYVCHRLGILDVRGVVEGDDGLFSMRSNLMPTSEHFEWLGLTIKPTVHDQINTASFCGLVFDEEDRTNVPDIRKVLAQLGWTNNRYSRARGTKLDQLLKAKVYSVIAEYNGCPILMPFCRWILSSLGKVRIGDKILSNMGTYERERLQRALSIMPEIKPVKPRTRALVSEHQGISLEEQAELELYFVNCEQCGEDIHKPLTFPQTVIDFASSWVDFGCNYVMQEDRRGRWLDYPGQLWPLWHSQRQELISL